MDTQGGNFKIPTLSLVREEHVDFPTIFEVPVDPLVKILPNFTHHCYAFMVTDILKNAASRIHLQM
jgi:hypothetical protein